jgi:hypothetical protein
MFHAPRRPSLPVVASPRGFCRRVGVVGPRHFLLQFNHDGKYRIDHVSRRPNRRPIDQARVHELSLVEPIRVARLFVVRKPGSSGQASNLHGKFGRLDLQDAQDVAARHESACFGAGTLFLPVRTRGRVRQSGPGRRRYWNHVRPVRDVGQQDDPSHQLIFVRPRSPLARVIRLQLGPKKFVLFVTVSVVQFSMSQFCLRQTRPIACARTMTMVSKNCTRAVANLNQSHRRLRVVLIGWCWMLSHQQ